MPYFFNFFMDSHMLEDGIEFLNLHTVWRIFTVLCGDVA